MAGFVGNDLYFSDPYNPHAWKRAYNLKTKADCVGLGVGSLGLVCVTKGIPELVFGTHPDSLQQDDINTPQAGISKRSVITFGDVVKAVIYASPDGMVMIDGSGATRVTRGYYEKKDWAELSPETMEKFGSMSSQELVEAYIQHRANNPQEAAPVADLSDSQVNYIKNQAGGEESYNTLVSWAGENLPDQYVAAFDNIVESGNVEAITIAVAGLRSQYEQVNGYEGKMLSGKGAPQQVDAFRSQAEVVQAMADPRYDNDPAYRNDVFEKLSRSNIDY